MNDATASAKRFHSTMGKMARMGLITFGGVGGMYLGARAVHAGTTAAAEEWRQQAEAKYSGLPEDERTQLWEQSVKLASHRRLSAATMFEMLRESALAMETTADAIAVSDEMSKALLYLSNTKGADGAVAGMRAFNKAMDNIEHITPAEYLKSLDGYIRAQQMTGADMDPDAFAQAIKYSRSAGKVFSDEYLFQWLPFKIAEVGGSDAGTQLRAFFDNTIGGTATKAVKGYQTDIGVRNEDGTMAFAEELLQNPERWINERLVPSLQSAGVDTENNVELAQVLNKVGSNRLARDFIIGAITNWDQKRRLTNYLPRTAGLGAADDVQDINPFATLDGLTSSLENLSGAAGNHIFPVIIPAINSLSDTINSISEKVRDMPGSAFGIALAGLGVGGIGAWKVGAGIVALTTAGPSLQTAAVMLQGAATSLGGAGAAGAAGGAASKAGWFASAATWVKGLAVAASPALLSDLAIGGPSSTEEFDAQVAEQAAIKAKMWGFIDSVVGKMDELNSLPSAYDGIEFGGMANNPMMTGEFPDDQSAPWGEAVAGAEEAGRAMETSLNVTASPQVDTASVQAALDMVEKLRLALSGVGSLINAESERVKGNLRGTFSDYGVSP